MLRIFDIQVSHAGTSSLVRALFADGSPDAWSAAHKIRKGVEGDRPVCLSPEERAAVLACVEEPREGLVELRAILMREFLVSLSLAQRLGCRHCGHALWSHDSNGCTAESCKCAYPQPPNIAERKAEYLHDVQAAQDALHKRSQPGKTEPREPPSYEGKFCASCGTRFTTGDIGWHWLPGESGKVIRFCAACWEELLREHGR